MQWAAQGGQPRGSTTLDRAAVSGGRHGCHLEGAWLRPFRLGRLAVADQRGAGRAARGPGAQVRWDATCAEAHHAGAV
jgi:hypothetical protein